MAKATTKKWRKFLCENAGKSITVAKLKRNMQYPIRPIPDNLLSVTIHRIKHSHNITVLE